MALLVGALLSSFLIVIMVNHSNKKQNSQNSQEFLVGVQAGYGGIEDVKALVDRVKNFTNLFVVSTTNVTNNVFLLNEACDYIYDAGLKFFFYFQDYTTTINMGSDPFSVWLLKAKEKYGDYFLGAYLFDEPGGNVLDKNKSMGTSGASTYELASEGFTRYIDQQCGSYVYLGDYANFSVFTSDYGLYWFDYKAGYDCVLVEYAWNHSRPLHTALCRGAATVQNRDWGVMLTHTYDYPPYIESGPELYEDLVTAYTLGAKYAVVFNFAKNDTNNTQFPILTDEHYEAIEDFWNYMQNNPENYGTVKADVALVLPKDYGFGFRNPDDTIWGMDGADQWTRKMLEDVNNFVDEYGFRLDLVFSDPEFNDVLQDYYDEVFIWNSGAEADSSYPVVNLNTSLGYNTIQEALDSGSTSIGDTIFVKAGTYQENLVIQKAVNLMGEDKETTIIDGGNHGTVVEVNLPYEQYLYVQSGQLRYRQNVNVSISGFTIRNSGENELDAGVRISTPSDILPSPISTINATLSDNIITDNYLGIQLINSVNNTFRSNNIFGNEYNFGVYYNISSTFINDIDASNTVDGKPIIYWINEHDKTVPSDAGYVALINCTDITVQNLELTNNYNGLLLVNTQKSTFSSNVFAGNYEGVSLIGSSDNLFRDNAIEDSVYSFGVQDGFANDVDVSNTVDGKPIIYWVDEHDRTVPSDASYVALVNCSGITVQSLNLDNNGQGILLSNTVNSILSENIIIKQKIGIQLLSSSSNTISDNRITDCKEGIRLESSSTNTVKDNVLEANENCGFNVVSSNLNDLSGNSFTDCNNGIMLGNASYNTISRNEMTSNKFGALIYDSNYIEYPINPEIVIPLIINSNGIFVWRTANNTFHHNNFINNTKHVQPNLMVVSEDFWDDGAEGNYWDDYNGTDSDGDGIGDTPYIIGQIYPYPYQDYIQDNYPLVKPVEIP